MYTVHADLRKRVEDSFTYHAPNGTQPDRYVEIRDRAKQLVLRVLELTPPGREQATFVTKMEEAIMWANKSIALEK